MAEAVVLDFDGVILESVDVKTEAFRKLFSQYPEYVDSIVEFHLENGGMSRYDKFRHIFSHYLKESLSDTMMNELAGKFSGYVFQGVIASSFVPGAHEFIMENHHKVSLFIVSATPEPEIREIVRVKGLSPFFKGVFGSPVRKAEHITRICKEHSFERSSVFFVGDSLNDYSAATEADVPFIGRVPEGNTDNFKGKKGVFATINDLWGLESLLSKEEVSL